MCSKEVRTVLKNSNPRCWLTSYDLWQFAEVCRVNFNTSRATSHERTEQPPRARKSSESWLAERYTCFFGFCLKSNVVPSLFHNSNVATCGSILSAQFRSDRHCPVFTTGNTQQLCIFSAGILFSIWRCMPHAQPHVKASGAAMSSFQGTSQVLGTEGRPSACCNRKR